MVGAAFTAALAGVLSAITAVEFYYFLNLQPGAATATTTSAAARAVSASVGEFEILVALVVAVGAFYVAVALIYRHIHQAEAAAAAGAGNRPLSDRVGALLLAAAGLLEFFLFVPVVPSLPCATDIVGALGLAAFRALPAAATATFFLGMMLLLIIVAHVRAGGEGGGGDFVGDGQIHGAVSILTKTAFAAAAGLLFLMAIALAK